MANDLFSALRTYLMKIGNGEKTPQELAAALNNWARESGEAIKARVEEEVKRNVSKMGFAKEADLLRLERELSKELKEVKELLKSKNSSTSKDTSPKRSASSKSAAKKLPKKNVGAKKKNGKQSK
jgi:hypothetical protein